MKAKALLIDLDGTILNTEDISHLAFQATFEKFGELFDSNIHTDILGTRSDYWIPYVIQHGNLNCSNHEFAKIYKDCFIKIEDRDLKFMSGAEEMLQVCKKESIPVAIVTSSSEESALRKIKKISLEKFFKHLIHGGSVDPPKPAAEPFLLAAKKVGIESNQVIAVEDGIAGMKSALSAGLFTVVCPTKYAKDLDFGPANLLVKDLFEVIPLIVC